MPSIEEFTRPGRYKNTKRLPFGVPDLHDDYLRQRFGGIDAFLWSAVAGGLLLIVGQVWGAIQHRRRFRPPPKKGDTD